MTQINEGRMISRRSAFLIGVGAALGMAMPTTLLTASDAEAQTAGMTRRQERRKGRQTRRSERRTGRQENREERQANRKGEPPPEQKPSSPAATTSLPAPTTGSPPPK